jgi:hypothetical protein
MWDVVKLGLAIAGAFVALLAIVVTIYAVREFRNATRDGDR